MAAAESLSESHLLYLFLELSRLLLQNGGLSSNLCTTLSLLLQVFNLPVEIKIHRKLAV